MIQTREDASALISTAISSHDEAWRRAVETEDYVIRMDPPFDDEELKKKGVAWTSNRNFGKGRADVEQAVSNKVKDIFSAVSLMEVKFHTFNEKKYKDKIFSFLQFDEMKADFAERVGDVFAEVLETDSAVDVFLSKVEYNAYMFGQCAVTRDKFTYLGNPIHYTDIAFEDRTKVSAIRKFVLFDVIKGEDVLKRLEKAQSADTYAWHDNNDIRITSSGWIETGLLELVRSIYNTKDDLKRDLREIKNLAQESLEIRYDTWEDVQLLIQNKGFMYASINLNNVFIAKSYEFEDSGYWETYSALSGEPNMATVIKEVIFQKFHANKVQEDLITLIKEFTINGSEFIHEIQGAGRFIAEDALGFDVKKNAIEDKLMVNGLIFVKKQNGLMGEKLKVDVIGGFGILDDDISFPEGQTKYDLSQHVQSIQFDNQEHKERMAHYKPSIDMSNRPTKDEVQFLSAQFNSARTSNIPFKLKDYSIIITNAFKSLAETEFLDERLKHKQEEFYSKLEDAFYEFKLKREDIKKILGCVANICINPVISDVQAIQQAMQVAASGPAKRRLVKMFLMALGYSRTQVKTLVEQETYGDEAEKVAFENNTFINSAEVVFGNNQDHIIHLTGHFYKIDQVLKGIQAGEDPVRAWNFLRNALSNTKLHVLAIGQNFFFKDRFKEFDKIQVYYEGKLKQLGVYLDRLKKQQEQQAQNQDVKDEITPELKEKFYQDRLKLMDKIERTNIRDQHARERELQKFEFNKELADRKTDDEIDRKKRLTELKMELSQTETAARMANGR